MPARVPRLPGAKRSEVLIMGAAGACVLAPLYMIMPGADERMEKQTTKWAPRWEKNINYFTPPVEKGVQRIEPPVSRAVQRVEERLPLERMAKSMESGVKKGFEKFTPSNGGPSSS
jgi:hypothetical protein